MATVAERLEQLGIEGAFGIGNPLRVLQGSDNVGIDQSHCKMVFMQVDMIPNNGKIKKVPVVVKTQLELSDSSDPLDARTLFFNEVAMNNVILKGIGVIERGLCPQPYYAESSDDINYDIIVIEDLRPQGYNTPSDLFLDHDHVCLTMKKLGELHGLSYKMKQTSQGRFEDLCRLLRPTKFPQLDGMHEAFIRRGFKSLLESSPSYSVVARAFKKLSSKNAADFTSSLQNPEEPYAVLLHGNFNKHSVLCKYDENGQVVDAKIIDFSQAMYGDPAADIASFLYLNTSPESRDRYWHEFLDSYWTGVTAVTENPGFTYKDFLKNFAQKAVCGYSICSFQLPYVMNGGRVPLETPSEMTVEDKIKYSEELGGEATTAAISTVVQHLLKEGYLEEYLLHVKLDESVD